MKSGFEVFVNCKAAVHEGSFLGVPPQNKMIKDWVKETDDIGVDLFVKDSSVKKTFRFNMSVLTKEEVKRVLDENFYFCICESPYPHHVVKDEISHIPLFNVVSSHVIDVKNEMNSDSAYFAMFYNCDLDILTHFLKLIE